MDDRDRLSEIDRALADALAVDMSPDFAARVRRRIAAEAPAPVPFRRSWHMALPAAAAALLVMAAGVATLWMRAPAAAPRLTARSVALQPVRPAGVAPMPPDVVGRALPARRARVGSVTAASAAAKEPEVLVPREEIEMYRSLIAAAQRVPHAMVVEAPEDLVANRTFPEIAIDPIKIELIVPPAGGEGDRQ
jgi:hypothetical protein